MEKYRRQIVIALAFLFVATLAPAPSQAQLGEIPRVFKSKITGSWFGRAVPIDPFCEPGTEGCPVPPEVIMTPIFSADGVMFGDDSLTFGGLHTTAYGHWRHDGPDSMEGTLVWLQGGGRGPDNSFIGGFRGRYTGTLVDDDRMEGFVNIWFFPFVDENGAAVLDANGFPFPDPLTPLGPFITDPAQCNPAIGCLAVLEFVVRRISVALDD